MRGRCGAYRQVVEPICVHFVREIQVVCLKRNVLKAERNGVYEEEHEEFVTSEIWREMTTAQR